MDFWVYAHDEDGDIVDDIDETGTLRDAIDVALVWARRHDMSGVTVRIVNYRIGDGSTVWAIGPVDHEASCETGRTVLA